MGSPWSAPSSSPPPQPADSASATSATRKNVLHGLGLMTNLLRHSLRLTGRRRSSRRPFGGIGGQRPRALPEGPRETLALTGSVLGLLTQILGDSCEEDPPSALTCPQKR